MTTLPTFSRTSQDFLLVGAVDALPRPVTRALIEPGMADARRWTVTQTSVRIRRRSGWSQFRYLRKRSGVQRRWNLLCMALMYIGRCSERCTGRRERRERGGREEGLVWCFKGWHELGCGRTRSWHRRSFIRVVWCFLVFHVCTITLTTTTLVHADTAGVRSSREKVRFQIGEAHQRQIATQPKQTDTQH